MKTADKITVVITEHELGTIGWDDPCRPNTPDYERVKQGRCKFDRKDQPGRMRSCSPKFARVPASK